MSARVGAGPATKAERDSMPSTMPRAFSTTSALLARPGNVLMAGIVPLGFTAARNSGRFAARSCLVMTNSKASSFIRQVQTTARTGRELGTPWIFSIAAPRAPSPRGYARTAAGAAVLP